MWVMLDHVYLDVLSGLSSARSLKPIRWRFPGLCSTVLSGLVQCSVDVVLMQEQYAGQKLWPGKGTEKR